MLLKNKEWPKSDSLSEPVHDFAPLIENSGMRTKKYPSDITREQFLVILPLLESVRRKTKPRTVDLYEVFCAVLYLLRTGCHWRALPGDFPKNVFTIF